MPGLKDIRGLPINLEMIFDGVEYICYNYSCQGLERAMILADSIAEK